MVNVSDRLNPAAGCRIMSSPRPRALGLTMAQVKASRTIAYMGVLKVHMIGGAQGLGMVSTVRSASSPYQVVSVKNCVRQVIAKRGRRSPKKGPRNPVFQGKVPNAYVYAERDFHEKLDRLTSMYKAIAREQAGTRLEDHYENLRDEFIQHWNRRGYAALETMERTVRMNTGSSVG